MIRYAVIIPLLALLVVLLAYTGSERHLTVSEDLVQVELKDLGIDPTTRSPVLILADREKGRILPIFIGINEATAISRGIDDEHGERPLTHDLIILMLRAMDTNLERVVIKDLQNNIFLADLVLLRGEESFLVDCRPSDAIAVAVRVDAPIYISKEVLDASASEELTRWWHREEAGEDLGLGFQDLTEELARAFELSETGGVLVASVEEGSIAQERGVERGDIILSVDGEAVNDPMELRIMLSERGGREAALVVLRKGSEREILLPIPAGEEPLDEPQ